LRTIRQAGEREGYRVSGFAPTSRAAHRLEEAGIQATTLQKFLLQKPASDAAQPQLLVLDESSLASTRQVHDFFKRLTPQDRILLVGDIRQHQAVDAGRPFEQMQDAGMRTARLDQIVRQQDAGLKRAVESMVQGKTVDAVNQLTEQRRVHTIPDPEERLKKVAQEYLKHPETSLVVSPDNPSRLEINRHVHRSLQAQGKVADKDQQVKILANRHELTGADRQWAAGYELGDVIRYTQGSRRIGVQAGEYAMVTQMDKDRNLLTVRRANGKEITYDPKRLRGVNVYQQEERQFAKGDRIQFTAPYKAANIANRELARIERIDSQGNLRLRLESGRTAQFNFRDHPHLDYGYAMTSYSSQGQTVDRVIIHVPEEGMKNRDLVNQRFAYVALSRARMDAQVYTHDASTLADRLSRDVSKTAAFDSGSFRQSGHFAFKEVQQRVQEQAQV
jgi:ATP-dependent exoDNAse (exonuclease V) alpha subunit